MRPYEEMEERHDRWMREKSKQVRRVAWLAPLFLLLSVALSVGTVAACVWAAVKVLQWMGVI